MPVTIRAPRPGDGAGMARAWLSAATYYADLDAEHFRVPPAAGMAESFEASLGTGGEGELMLVADVDGQVTGWLTARIEYPAPGAARQMTREHGWTRLHIDALMVDQVAWHQGVGTVLLTAAEGCGSPTGAGCPRAAGGWPREPKKGVVQVPHQPRRPGTPAEDEATYLL